MSDAAERHRRNFNPRSPHGERQKQISRPGGHMHFNPRSPHGERHDGAETERAD